MKTIQELKSEFQKKFTVDELVDNIELQTLYHYLQNHARKEKTILGDTPTPSEYICELMQKHLNYDPRKTEKP